MARQFSKESVDWKVLSRPDDIFPFDYCKRSEQQATHTADSGG